MALTTTQTLSLVAALKAETDQSVVAALAIRNDVLLTDWCNAASTVDAWHEACSGTELFEAMDLTKFDGLTAGKRDSWRLMLSFAPINFGRQSNRKAVVDVWGNVDSISVLQKCLRKATNAEKYIGGTTVPTNTVSALKLDFTGAIGLTELSVALNTNP